MARNEGIRFISSSIKIPRFEDPHPRLIFPNLPFARQTLSSNIQNAKLFVEHFIRCFSRSWNPGRHFANSFLCSTSLSLTQQEDSNPAPPEAARQPPQKGYLPPRGGRDDEERVLISEVLIRNKDGEELEGKDLEAEAAAALKACRPNSALTVQEVQEDVHRIIDSGFFSSCMPVAVDTRDGIRLVSDVEILSGGILRLVVSEAEVNNIAIRFLDRRTGEPSVGKTKPQTILRQLTTKKGQVYSLLQGRRDVETVLTMGIMEDVSIMPQPAGDTAKVDLVMNCVERVSGGFSAGGGISSGFAYSHRNVFGRNQKLNLSLERGQIDSIFRINYTDPWIEGDDKRTSRTIMVQNSRTPGTLVHGNDRNAPDGNITIDRITAGIEYNQPIRPKWSGTAGIIFQVFDDWFFPS
ncbi:Outer envelope protein 80, chloroplastic [Asimina triloba]